MAPAALSAFISPVLPAFPSLLHRPRWTCVISRVLLVPDHLSPSRPLWYSWLSSSLPLPLFIAPVPNPYDSNSKRWERVWLTALRKATAPGDLLLGHGSGADVVLRFLEGTSADGVVLVLPSGDEYFAGERHGRRYHWERIRANVGDGGLGVVVSEAAAGKEENDNLANMLRADMVLEVARGRGRLADEERVDEVLQLVLRAT